MKEAYHDFAKLGKGKVACKEAFEDSAEIGSKKADWEKRRKKVDWEKHIKFVLGEGKSPASKHMLLLGILLRLLQ